MLELLGKTQQQLLRQLHLNKNGLTTFELCERLGISRNATKQHLSALESNKLIQFGSVKQTAGRPTQSYVLTTQGMECFPRKYSWFAEMLLESIRAEKDEKGLRLFLEKIGTKISSKYIPELSALNVKDRLKKVGFILSELGYEAEIVPSKNKMDASKIEISNCIFQELAVSCPEVCCFDASLISKLAGQKVEQQSCITRGSNVCCFAIKKQD
jgi:predicted ArsR family transcriptional regulator